MASMRSGAVKASAPKGRLFQGRAGRHVSARATSLDEGFRQEREMPSEYELIYFDAKGAVETVRLLLAAAEVEYTDNRLELEFQDGQPNAPTFYEGKQNGEYLVNLNRVPVLRIDNFKLGQTKAIERYVARTFGFMGMNDLEEAAVDSYCEHIRDIKDAAARTRTAAGSDENARNEAMKSFYNDTLPQWLNSLEVVTGPAGVAVGDSVSLADISLYQLTEYFTDEDKVIDALASCPKLRACIATVQSLPGIQRYLENRPQTPF